MSLATKDVSIEHKVHGSPALPTKQTWAMIQVNSFPQQPLN